MVFQAIRSIVQKLRAEPEVVSSTITMVDLAEQAGKQVVLTTASGSTYVVTVGANPMIVDKIFVTGVTLEKQGAGDAERVSSLRIIRLGKRLGYNPITGSTEHTNPKYTSPVRRIEIR